MSVIRKNYRLPASIKKLCRLHGWSLGGQNRKEMSAWLDNSLMALYEAAVNKHGPEHAAFLLFWTVRRDPDFKCPQWLIFRFRKHRRYILESVTDMGETGYPGT